MRQKIKPITSVFTFIIVLASININASSSNNDKAIKLPNPETIINEAIATCNFFDDTNKYMSASDADVVKLCDKLLKLSVLFPNLIDAVKQETYLNNRIWGKFLFDFLLDIEKSYKKSITKYYRQEVNSILKNSYKIAKDLDSKKRMSPEQRNAIVIIKSITSTLARLGSAATGLCFDNDIDRLILSFICLNKKNISV